MNLKGENKKFRDIALLLNAKTNIPWIIRILCFISFLALLWACSNREENINTGNLQFYVNNNMQTMVSIDQQVGTPLMTDYSYSEYLISGEQKISDFHLNTFQTKKIDTPLGQGKMYEIKGNYETENLKIRKILIIKTFNNFPGMITTQVTYQNIGQNKITINGWVNNHYHINSNNDTPSFWSFQGSSSRIRDDWVLKVNPGFYQKNFMGMNNSDYGGGIPVTSLWRRNGGIAIGHCDTFPRLVSLPVKMGDNDQKATIKVEKDFQKPLTFATGDTIHTLETFVMTQQGDYFSSLRKYANFMYKKGLTKPHDEDWAYESMWCAWGYERNFTVEEILNTLPKVKELGIKWVVVDDGYQKCEGDWELNSHAFPGSDKQMKDLVHRIHQLGLKAQIWWAPLAVDPGSNYLKKHPNSILLSEEGTPRYITWWDSYYLSPVDSGVVQDSREQVVKFMEKYGFDGLKLDGQHMNAVPPDYAHGDQPLNAVHNLPGFFKAIYNTARSINPHAVIQYCPCGDCVSIFNLAYANQAVASDPMSSWQIRLKGKTIKALAPGVAYFGDHVELSDGGDDFASSFGIGAVLGTKFTWPKDNTYVRDQGRSFILTSGKEQIWKHWFSLYNKMMLSKGTYMGGLYDLGYDKPETHAIKKNHRLYYAFYSDKWDGLVEFRGLDKQRYRIYDYVNEKEIGEINGPTDQLKIHFDQSCLVEAIPIEKLE